jgi:hypothetical protein
MKIRKHISRDVIDSNRKNSHHGHGPTTTRGKEAVRHNAVTHGLLARALVFKSEKEQQRVRAYRKRLCKDLAPADALETMYVEDLANIDWRLKRATRWEQQIRMGHTTEVVEEALRAGTKTFDMWYLPEVEGSRGWRCKELSLSFKNDTDSEHRSHSSMKTPEQPPPYGQKSDKLSGARGGVELSAKLADPLDDLDRILRYEKAIRKDRDNAIDRLLRLQKARARANGKAN